MSLPHIYSILFERWKRKIRTFRRLYVWQSKRKRRTRRGKLGFWLSPMGIQKWNLLKVKSTSI